MRARPEPSSAKGSFQFTGTDETPTSTDVRMSDGQFKTSGDRLPKATKSTVL